MRATPLLGGLANRTPEAGGSESRAERARAVQPVGLGEPHARDAPRGATPHVRDGSSGGVVEARGDARARRRVRADVVRASHSPASRAEKPAAV